MSQIDQVVDSQNKSLNFLLNLPFICTSKSNRWSTNDSQMVNMFAKAIPVYLDKQLQQHEIREKVRGLIPHAPSTEGTRGHVDSTTLHVLLARPLIKVCSITISKRMLECCWGHLWTTT